MLGNGSQVCIEIFAYDTNAMVKNDERSITYFWECVQIYCSAFAFELAINHSKTRFRKSIRKRIKRPPPWLIHEGCKPFQDGQRVCILGIPMGFKVSLKKQREWIMNKVEEKLKKWQNRMLNMTRRKMVINHFIIPLVI